MVHVFQFQNFQFGWFCDSLASWLGMGMTSSYPVPYFSITRIFAIPSTIVDALRVSVVWFVILPNSDSVFVVCRLSAYIAETFSIFDKIRHLFCKFRLKSFDFGIDDQNVQFICNWKISIFQHFLQFFVLCLMCANTVENASLCSPWWKDYFSFLLSGLKTQRFPFVTVYKKTF